MNQQLDLALTPAITGTVIASGVFGLDPVDIQFDFTVAPRAHCDSSAEHVATECYHALVCEITDAIDGDHYTDDERPTYSDEHSKARYLFCVDVDSTCFIDSTGRTWDVPGFYQEVYIIPNDAEAKALHGA